MLFFNENGGNYFIKWACDENTKHERTHITQISTTKLEKYQDVGLDFHYELHFSEREQFVRFDCSCYPYGNYKGKTRTEFFEQLALSGQEGLYKIRTNLKAQFKRVFSNSQYRLTKNMYNYAYLLRFDFNAGNYKDAIKESEKFINETYDNIVEIIEAVVNV